MLPNIEVLELTGLSLDQVFSSKVSACMPCTYCGVAQLPNSELKIQAKQQLGSLPLDSQLHGLLNQSTINKLVH
jgi:hypothetical protein